MKKCNCLVMSTLWFETRSCTEFSQSYTVFSAPSVKLGDILCETLWLSIYPKVNGRTHVV